MASSIPPSRKSKKNSQKTHSDASYMGSEGSTLSKDTLEAYRQGLYNRKGDANYPPSAGTSYVGTSGQRIEQFRPPSKGSGAQAESSGGRSKGYSIVPSKSSLRNSHLLGCHC